jgi:hypothetical protein
MKAGWNDCAEHYLEQWYSLDRPLVSMFSGSSITCEMLGDLCSPHKYQVARTVPGNGIEKYRAFASMLNTYQDKVIAREDVSPVIEQEVSNMYRIY